MDVEEAIASLGGTGKPTRIRREVSKLSSELSVWYHPPAVMSLAKSSIRSVSRSAIRKAILLIVVGFCVSEFGCQDVGTTWSEEARSPDGNWLATARSQQWGGPGTAYDATTVYLKWVKGSRPPTEVLVFSHQYATMVLKMEWVTATHLEVIYGPSPGPADHVSLDFQVVKCAGIEISVHDLSKETNNSDATAKEDNFSMNECFAKGGLGVVGTNLYIDLKSAKNELQLSAGNKWTGQSTPAQEVVIFFENKILSPQALPDGFDLSKSVVISFEGDKVRFFDFGKMSGGYYKRPRQN
jgi:hypothetical protein